MNIVRPQFQYLYEAEQDGTRGAVFTTLTQGALGVIDSCELHTI